MMKNEINGFPIILLGLLGEPEHRLVASPPRPEQSTEMTKSIRLPIKSAFLTQNPPFYRFSIVQG
jgi:hypothetical protein